MFCGNCGTELPEGAAFCPECGTKAEVFINPEMTVDAERGVDPKLVKKVKAGIIVAVIIIIAAVALCGARLFNGGAENTAKRFIEAMFDGDGEDIVRLMPKDTVKLIIKNNIAFDDKEDFADSLEDELDYVLDRIEAVYGDDWRYKIKEINKRKLSDDETDTLVSWYAGGANLGMNIKEAYFVSAECLVSDKKGKNYEEGTIEFNVIKVKGKWCIDFSSMQGDFFDF